MQNPSVEVSVFNQSGGTLTSFSQVFDFSLDQKLNDKSSLTFAVNINDVHLSDEVLQVGNIIKAYFRTSDSFTQIFEGFIQTIEVNNQKIVFTVMDYVGYLDYCITSTGAGYGSGWKVKDIITNLYTHFNNDYALPFVLGKNDIETTASFDFAAGDSFLSILQKIAEVAGEFRVQDGKLDFSAVTGETKTGLLSYNVLSENPGNITAFSWSQTLDDFANRIVYQKSGSIGVYSYPDLITAMGRKYAKFMVKSTSSFSPAAEVVKMPQITLDFSKLNWADYNLGDRQNVQIYLGEEKNYLNFDFLGLVSARQIKISGAKITANFTIAEQYKKSTGLVDVIERIKKELRDTQIG